MKLADILFSLLSVCLSVCVSVCTQSTLQQCKKFSWRIYALSERLLVLDLVHWEINQPKAVRLSSGTTL